MCLSELLNKTFPSFLPSFLLAGEYKRSLAAKQKVVDHCVAAALSNLLPLLCQRCLFKIKRNNHLQEIQVHIFLIEINSLRETLQIQ